MTSIHVSTPEGLDWNKQREAMLAGKHRCDSELRQFCQSAACAGLLERGPS